MREIKFRAWEVSKLPDGTIRELMHSTDGLLAWGIIPSPMLEHGFHDELEDGEKWIWMQYIGLHDIDGLEVYEGDIVTEGANYPSVIEWCEHNEKIVGSGWCLHELDPRNRHIYYDTGAFTTIPNKWRVLGNIYEHSYLVKPSWLKKLIS